jgi:hypothetical protein
MQSKKNVQKITQNSKKSNDKLEYAANDSYYDKSQPNRRTRQNVRSDKRA